MRKRIIAAFVAVVLLAGAVGLGVHLMNREAHAVNYYYEIHCINDHNDDGAGFTVVEITISGGAPTEHMADADGKILITKDSHH